MYVHIRMTVVRAGEMDVGQLCERHTDKIGTVDATVDIIYFRHYRIMQLTCGCIMP